MTVLSPRRKRILLVFTTVPWPLRAHGVSVRYLPIIDYMSRRHEIDLLIISGGKDEFLDLNGLRQSCRKISVIQDPRKSPKNLLSIGKTYASFLLPWTPPLSLVSHGGSEVTRGIINAARGERYDTLVWIGGYLLPNLLHALPSISVEKVFVDFIDSRFLHMLRWKENIFPIKILDSYERWKTCRWEGKVIREVGAAIYISKVDAGAVPLRLAPYDKRYVVPNGVSLDSGMEVRGDLPSPNIGFLGNMGYPPNIEAVHRLYEQIYRPIRDEMPGLSLIVIGRDPVESVRDLGAKPGVVVTGTVDDIWPYVNSVDLFVFPLLTGTGLKNKIIEVMGAGRSVITTAIGNEGIDAVDGKDITVCETSEDFRREVARLLRSADARRSIGESARRFVRDKFSWSGILPRYEEIVIGSGIRKQIDPVPS